MVEQQQCIHAGAFCPANGAWAGEWIGCVYKTLASPVRNGLPWGASQRRGQDVSHGHQELPGRLRTEPGSSCRVLAGSRGRDLLADTTAAGPRPQPGAALRLVSGRCPEHVLQRPRPARGPGQGCAGRPGLRLRDVGHPAELHVCGTDGSRGPVRRCPAPQRRRQGRPRGDLHADDPRGRDRDAGHRTARRCALRRLRRVRPQGTCRPNPRRRACRGGDGVRRHRAVAPD